MNELKLFGRQFPCCETPVVLKENIDYAEQQRLYCVVCGHEVKTEKNEPQSVFDKWIDSVRVTV